MANAECNLPPKDGASARDKAFDRRVPGLLAFLHPFRLVLRPEDGEWASNIDEVNKRSWDYEKLHRLVGSVDIGLPPPYCMLLGLDGALVLPPHPETNPVEKAIEHFNQALAAVLLGGIYCEAIGLADVAQAYVLDWKHVRLFTMMEPHRASSAMIFHQSARTLRTPADQATALISPQRVTYYDFYNAHSAGRSMLARVPELSPNILLKGVSAIAHREWSAVLTNITIINEQLTSILWQRHIIETAVSIDIRGRKDQLKYTRAWSAATRQELLMQKGIISQDTLKALFMSRQARNGLVHRGSSPNEDEAKAAYSAFEGLFKEATGVAEPALFTMQLSEFGLSGPYDTRPTIPSDIKPTHWLPIPHLPNEAEINRLYMETRKSID